MEQSAESIHLAVEKIQTDGTTKLKTGMGYTFDDRGLQIARQGQQMKNLLDNTGMYVTRQGQTVLQANDKGVLATDVTVNNYLIVGDHARFEDYGQGRTACFYLEG
jgi:tRNA A-37 threonylcarbamoyl transferase component Bud32